MPEVQEAADNSDAFGKTPSPRENSWVVVGKSEGEAPVSVESAVTEIVGDEFSRVMGTDNRNHPFAEQRVEG